MHTRHPLSASTAAATEMRSRRTIRDIKVKLKLKMRICQTWVIKINVLLAGCAQRNASARCIETLFLHRRPRGSAKKFKTVCESSEKRKREGFQGKDTGSDAIKEAAGEDKRSTALKGTKGCVSVWEQDPTHALTFLSNTEDGR